MDSTDNMHPFLGEDGAIETIVSCIGKDQVSPVPAFPDLAGNLPDIGLTDNYGRNDSHSMIFPWLCAGYHDTAESQLPGLNCHPAG
jgi:hypothetical protein